MNESIDMVITSMKPIKEGSLLDDETELQLEILDLTGNSFFNTINLMDNNLFFITYLNQ